MARNGKAQAISLQSQLDEESKSHEQRGRVHEETGMTLGTVLLIVLILLLIGAIPTWPYSSGWGYGPSGIVGVLLLVLIILLLMGRI
jgi:hypothetical protein